MAASELMKTLAKQREDIEKEIEELTDLLQSQKGVGMDGPLIDPEGYPRNDIDVYSVRHARHKIACLQTDYTCVMKDIETELYRIHDQMREEKAKGAEGNEDAMDVAPGSASVAPPATPFVRVDKVDQGSPAFDAGLSAGDEVTEFGSITSANFTGIKQVGELVQHSLGRSVRVVVQRDGKSLPLSLTPGPWSGRGNLGCNVVVIKR